MLVETIVREDAIALYGFLETGERDWFRILTTVQGVGARVALSILSTLSPDEIARAIAAQDRATLSRPPGVGPKLAARLATPLGGGDENLQVFPDLLLADEIVERLRAQRQLGRVFLGARASHQALRNGIHRASSCRPARITASSLASAPSRWVTRATAPKASTRL